MEDQAILETLLAWIRAQFLQRPLISVSVSVTVLYLGRHPIETMINATGSIFTFFKTEVGDKLYTLGAESLNSASNAGREFRETYDRGIVSSFFIGTVIMAIVGLAATANFLLMQRPLTDIFGNYEIQGLSAGVVGALALILLELLVGFFLFEFLGVSDIFKFRQRVPSAVTNTIVGITAALLLGFCIFEAGIAVFREDLISDAQLLQFELGGNADSADSMTDAGSGESWRIFLQAGLGFMLPLVIALSAIAIERVVPALDAFFFTTLGVIAVIISFPFIVLGMIGGYIAMFLVGLIQLLVAVPQAIHKGYDGITQLFSGRSAES